MIYFIIFICIWFIAWLALGIYFTWTGPIHITFQIIIAMGFISLGIAMTFMVIIAAIVSCALLFHLICTLGF